MRYTNYLKFFATYALISAPPLVMAVKNSFDTALALDLVPRASCAVAGYTACGQGLPGDFCCAAGTTCKAFNSGASAICCPAGQDCSNILPITCDMNQLDVSKFPTAPIHSTQLNGNLPSCGTQCCPQGYSCLNQQCVLGAAAAATSHSSAAPSATSLASSPSITDSGIASSVTLTATVSVTSPSIVPASSLPDPAVHCSMFPGGAVAAGFFPGMAVGALLAVLFIVCFARRKDNKHGNEDEDKPRINPIVSEPMYHGDSMATRTDFLRRASKSLYSPRVKSFFNRSPTSPDGIGRSLKSPQTPPPRTPRTPESRIGLRQEPSMESIKIYSPPDGRVGRGTTFTELMANAGFRHDDAFLGGRLNRESTTTRNLT